MLKYLLAVFIVFVIKTDAHSQFNLLKGNWEDRSGTTRLWIADTTSNNNTLKLTQDCDEEYNLRVIMDTLFFTQGETNNREEISFKILLLNDSVLKVKVLRNITYYPSGSFSGKTMQVILLNKTEKKFEESIRFEKLRYRYGSVMVVGDNDELEIDSLGLIRCNAHKTEIRTDSNNEKHYFTRTIHGQGTLSKTDFANFLQLIDSIQLPSLHFIDYCVMDGEWAEIIFDYNGRERVINFHLWESNDPYRRKLLKFLYSLPNSKCIKPVKKKINISFAKQSKN